MDKDRPKIHGLSFRFTHPTASVLDTLEHEIEVFCKNHGIGIEWQDKYEIPT